MKLDESAFLELYLYYLIFNMYFVYVSQSIHDYVEMLLLGNIRLINLKINQQFNFLFELLGFTQKSHRPRHRNHCRLLHD